VAVGGLIQALTSLLILQSATNQTMPLLAWLMSNLACRDWNYVFMLCPYTLNGAIVAQMSWKMLNRLACGDETDMYLGVSLIRGKVFLLVIASLLAASAVAAVGIIGYVGLMVPHAMRCFFPWPAGSARRYRCPRETGSPLSTRRA
jgi:ABC-type Fe3+-siderophore transport system permease subunit